MTQPVTRDLARIIEACEIVEAELRFQSERLEQNVRPESSGSDPQHLADLGAGYASSARYVGILRRYQEGRVERVRGGAVSEGDGSIDNLGRAAAFVEG